MKRKELFGITFSRDLFNILAKELKNFKCINCGRKVTKKNVGGFVGKPLTFRVVCDNLLCLSTIMKR